MCSKGPIWQGGCRGDCPLGGLPRPLRGPLAGDCAERFPSASSERIARWAGFPGRCGGPWRGLRRALPFPAGIARGAGFPYRLPRGPLQAAEAQMPEASRGFLSWGLTRASSRRPLKQKAQRVALGLLACGEMGIRTPGTQRVQRFSRPPRSTTPASLLGYPLWSEGLQR